MMPINKIKKETEEDSRWPQSEKIKKNRKKGRKKYKKKLESKNDEEVTSVKKTKNVNAMKKKHCQRKGRRERSR